MESTYRIAGHVFRVSGENLCKAVYHGKVIMFLGESGINKSTHYRLYIQTVFS